VRPSRHIARLVHGPRRIARLIRPPRRRSARRGGGTHVGTALGWWIAGFEERIAPERQTVEERVRWGTETRTSAGDGIDLVVTFPDERPRRP
jgi:hypothetical protein